MVRQERHFSVTIFQTRHCGSSQSACAHQRTYSAMVTTTVQAGRAMMAEISKRKRPNQLSALMESWKPTKLVRPNLLEPKSAGVKSPTKPQKVNKKRNLLRFRQAFALKQALPESAEIETEIASSSLIVIDGNRTKTELEAAVGGFAKDC